MNLKHLRLQSATHKFFFVCLPSHWMPQHESLQVTLHWTWEKQTKHPPHPFLTSTMTFLHIHQELERRSMSSATGMPLGLTAEFPCSHEQNFKL